MMKNALYKEPKMLKGLKKKKKKPTSKCVIANREFLFEGGNVLQLHISVNILKTIELYTLR